MKNSSKLLDKIAEKTPQAGAVRKKYTEADIATLVERKRAGEKLESFENGALRQVYNRNKKWLLEKEATNRGYIYILESVVGTGIWLKAFNFSALYFSYRIADRLGRKARISSDGDYVLRADYVVSIAGSMEKLVAQIEGLNLGKYEGKQNGIHVFKLTRPASPDEYGRLCKEEAVMKDRVHSLLVPKAADPALYHQINVVIQQLVPKAQKLSMKVSRKIGEEIIENIHSVLHIYHDYCSGIYEGAEKQPYIKMQTFCNSTMAWVEMAGEAGFWRHDALVPIGRNLNRLMMMVEKEIECQKNSKTKN